MRKYIYPIVVAVALVLAYIPILSSSDESAIFYPMANQARDSFFKIRHFSFGSSQDLSSVVVVGISEESSEKMDLRWPWPRYVFAKMIDHLSKAGAKVIAFNLSFTGEESDTKSTTLLANAISQSDRVVIGSTFNKNGQLVKPVALIYETDVSYGFLEKIIDKDSYIRRSYVARFYEQTSERYNSSESASFEKSFPLQVLTKLSPIEGQPAYNQDLNLLTVGKPNIGIYLQADGYHDINFTSLPSDFKTLSAYKIYEGRFDPADVSGKIVFIGITSALFGDYHATPLGFMSGVYIHANEYLSLSGKRPLKFVHPAVVAGISMIVSFCLLVLILFRSFWIGLAAFSFSWLGLFIGAQFLFSKDQLLDPFVLLSGPVVAFVLANLANATRLFFEKKALETKIIHDKMTGLYNYDYLRLRLDDEWKICKKLKTPVTIVMTDLDRFKKINDTLGHEVGNIMIKRAGEVIRKSARGYDVVSRYGGDEFVIMLWRTNKEDALIYKNRLRNMYHEMASKLEKELQDSSISIGLATYDPARDFKEFSSPQQLIEAADKDLFEDKESRRKPGEARR